MSNLYLSLREFLLAPTGLEWSSIPVRGATPAQQAAEARRILRRASSWANGVCGQKLYATQDPQVERIGGLRVRLGSDGEIWYNPDFSPITSVDQLALSVDGIRYTTLPWVPIVPPRSASTSAPRYFTAVPPAAGSMPLISNASGGSWRDGWLKVTYTSGYPNAALTADAAAADTTLMIDDPTGMRPGDRLTLYDGEDDEDVVLVASYVAGSNPLTLAAPLAFAHAAGLLVSAVPEAVREAVLLYATDLVRQRGKDAVAVLPSGGARLVQGTVSSKLDQAIAQLRPFRRVL